MDEWIFMKLSGYVGHDTRNNLERFGDVAFNPLNTGFIFLFSRPISRDGGLRSRSASCLICFRFEKYILGELESCVEYSD